MAPSGASSDVSSLVAALRDMRGSRRPLVPIAVSVSDLHGQLALLEFETIPSRKTELETVLRWRLERELHVGLADARLAYRVFRRSGGARKPMAVVLAATIGTRMMASYEEACLEAGLFPVSVGLSSFHLFEFWRPVMQLMLTRQTNETASDDECFFVHATEWGLVFFALRFGCPVFVRIKPWMISPEAGSDPSPSSDRSAALYHEIIATLQFYTESLVEATSTRIRPLFLVKTAQDFGQSGPDGSGSLDLDRLRPWNVALLPLDRETLSLRLPGLEGGQAEAFPMTSLPALAALTG